MSDLSIILAEDDEDDVFFFREALTGICNKSSITVCNNGEELLRKLADSRPLPDIIFLDINMPVMNGLECLKHIKSKPYLKNVPVIILTTSSSRTTIEITYRLGAHYFVKKPACFKDLKKVLRSILQVDWCQYSRPSNSTDFVYKYNAY